MPDKVYLDGNGNPIPAQKQYLDEQGNPTTSKPTVGVYASPDPWSVAGIKSKLMTLRDKAINQLPAIGGTLGGLAAGGAGLESGPGAILAAGAGAGAGGGLGETLRQGLTEYFHPEDKKMTPSEAAREIATQGTVNAGGEILGRGVGKIVGPTVKKTMNRLFYGADLGPGTNLERVLPDIQAEEAVTPSKDLRSWIANVKSAKNKIGNEVDSALMTQVPGPTGNVSLGSVKTSGQPIADAITDLIHNHPSNVQMNPAKVNAIRQRAIQYAKPQTYSWLNDRRIVLNDELNKFYALKTPAEQATYLSQHPNFEIDKAEADAIRDVVYPQMDAAAGKPQGYFENLQQRRGQLRSIESQATEHADKVENQSQKIAGAPILTRPRVYLHPSGKIGMFTNIGAILHRPDPAADASRAVNKAYSRTAATKLAKILASGAGAEGVALPVRELGVASEPDEQPQP